MTAPDPVLAGFIQSAGLAEAGDPGDWVPLSGGVSSDIWRVRTRAGQFCVKRALPQLRVAAEWLAPVDRNAREWDYLSVAWQIVPDHVPRPLAHNPDEGLFAMAWLSPQQYPIWKTDLMSGRVSIEAAGAVGALLGKIHATTAGDQALATQFATDAGFHALRIEPYLLATAARHPDLAPIIRDIAAATVGNRRALVHGDVSPKNILLGPAGPVLLDAECAWFGDPAFDLAFCLNHLTIKARVVTGAADLLSRSFEALSDAYFRHVNWEDRAALEARAAELLPVLALARVDGKSPVEYLDDAQRDTLRVVARRSVAARPATLSTAHAQLLGS
jgi:aminoglycoside phosphotransferase (APT) family kinase protein